MPVAQSSVLYACWPDLEKCSATSVHGGGPHIYNAMLSNLSFHLFSRQNIIDDTKTSKNIEALTDRASGQAGSQAVKGWKQRNLLLLFYETNSRQHS